MPIIKVQRKSKFQSRLKFDILDVDIPLTIDIWILKFEGFRDGY